MVFSDAEGVDNIADELELDVIAVNVFGSAGMNADGSLEQDLHDGIGVRLFRCICPRLVGRCGIRFFLNVFLAENYNFACHLS